MTTTHRPRATPGRSTPERPEPDEAGPDETGPDRRRPGGPPADEPADAPNDAARRTALGRYGEEVACRYLVEEVGMVLLDRNWRCPVGEIDLVLRDGDDLVVAEVKTRSSTACGTPHEAVSPAKLARLRRLAAAWLAAHQARPRGVRIDLVAVLRPPRGAAVVEHVRGLG